MTAFFFSSLMDADIELEGYTQTGRDEDRERESCILSSVLRRWLHNPEIWCGLIDDLLRFRYIVHEGSRLSFSIVSVVQVAPLYTEQPTYAAGQSLLWSRTSPWILVIVTGIGNTQVNMAGADIQIRLQEAIRELSLSTWGVSARLLVLIFEGLPLIQIFFTSTDIATKVRV